MFRRGPEPLEYVQYGAVADCLVRPGRQCSGRISAKTGMTMHTMRATANVRARGDGASVGILIMTTRQRPNGSVRSPLKSGAARPAWPDAVENCVDYVRIKEFSDRIQERQCLSYLHHSRDRRDSPHRKVHRRMPGRDQPASFTAALRPGSRRTIPIFTDGI